MKLRNTLVFTLGLALLLGGTGLNADVSLKGFETAVKKSTKEFKTAYKKSGKKLKKEEQKKAKLDQGEKSSKYTGNFKELKKAYKSYDKSLKSSKGLSKKQREKLDARIQATEARLKNSERKKDTRRKILIGAYYLDLAAKENNMSNIKKIMDEYLKRNSDRELFDLEPLSENKKD